MNPLRGLRFRLTATVVLTTLAASAIVAIGLSRYTATEFREFLEVETEMTAEVRLDTGELAARVRNGEGVAAELESLAAGDRLLLFRHDGTLLADTDPAAGEATYRDGEVDARMRRDGADERIRLRGGIPVGDDAVLFRLPRREPSPANRGALFTRRIGAAHVIGVGLATGLALVIALVLSRRILGPVERLTVAARELARGDLGQRVEADGADEVGELGRSFNAMAEALERHEAARRNMVADVAHELRTPLTHLRCRLESVQDGLQTADGALVDALHAEIVHLGRLVDDLQELALAEAGRLPLYPVDVDPATLVREVVASLPASGATVEIAAARDLPRVRVDPDRLRQVLRNLLHNALQHGRDDGRVVVDLDRDDASVVVTVADDGPGIPEGHRERVFERFHRTDPSRDRATGGAGLGLSIARQLVLAWGGTIAAEDAPAGGAAFRFTIPRA